MRLEEIKIKGFKSIRELALPLAPLNVLIGANGAGKSNFMGVFKFLNAIVNENLQLYVGTAGGADQLLYFGRQTTERIEIEVWFTVKENLANGYKCSLIPAAGDKLTFESEQTYSHDRSQHPRPYEQSLGAGHQESNLQTFVKSHGGVARHTLKAMRSWKIYHFHDTSDSAKVKQTVSIDDNHRLRDDASNLAAYLYFLKEKEPGHYRNIVDAIRLVAPFFGDFDLRPNPLNPDKIKLEWRERSSDAYFDANALSDGTLRFISLATLLLQPPSRLPSTLFLDEPELGLHPYAITILANLLRSAAEQTQVIVATQSVTLVNQFEPGDIIVVDRMDDQSVFVHLGAEEIDSWLDDYGLGDLWEKNVFGGRPTA
jgi:predicted ATPase